MIRFLALLVISLLFAVSSALAADTAYMLRFPDVSQDSVAFVYDNDIWVVAKLGGTASPLSSPAGREINPKFSPDGQEIAFSASYDGNTDIYVLPVTGGSPRRLTYHPGGDEMVDYHPDGRVLFSAYRKPLFPQRRLFFADPQGGLPEALPMAYAQYASISPDGKLIAFAPWSVEYSTWNRYQGGTATDLWLFNLETLESERITDHPGTDDLPMYHGDKIYYLSDAGPENRRNIWVYNTTSSLRKQVTNFSDYEIKWPSIGPEEIVFEHGGLLYLLSLGDHKTRQLKVTIPGDHPNVRAELTDVSGAGSPEAISPNAKRMAGSFRGDIWTLPAENGYKQNLTRTDGVAERDPSWSPDGKWIAYFSDESGEYQLYRQLSDGSGEPQQLTSDLMTFFYAPVWSPDSEKLSFSDKAGNLYIHLIEEAETFKIDKDPWAAQHQGVVWASDSNWCAYMVGDADNRNPVIKLYNLAERSSHQVTSSMFPSYEPVFDLEGDYLFFLTDRNFNASYSPIGDWGEHFFVDTCVIAYVPLRADIKSPFAPENDAEEIADDEDEDEVDSDDADEDQPEDSNDDTAETALTSQDDDAEPADEDAIEEAEDIDDTEDAEGDDADGDDDEEENDDENLVIDLEGLEGRARILPVGAGTYSNLAGGKHKLFYLSSEGQRRSGQASIKSYDLDEQEESTVLSDAGEFVLTPDASKMAVYARGRVYITKAGQGAKLDKPIDTGNMLAMIDPAHEWPQLVNDSWRIYRDFFYDPNMHGVDWAAQRQKALKMVRHAANREDVSYIIGQMVAELSVGHAYVGGPGEGSDRLGIGVLGCDFELAEDANGNRGFQISKIYRGAEWELDMHGPLDTPGDVVNEGDFLLAINGIPLQTGVSPYAAFAGLANQTIALTVNTQAAMDGEERDVLVETMLNDYELRLRDWIEQNRQHVYEASGGKIGYIYVRNTSGSGFADMQRQFLGQYQMDGLIIDERWNGGGLSPHRMVELLSRPIHNFWGLRDSVSWRTPQFAHVGPKAMLINHAAGSGGDSFPYIFRQLEVGPLIGTRTWGGLVGLSGNPGLIDGGYNTVPRFAIYDLEGTWAVEGHGVDPDIEVVDDPTLLAEGLDPQLDAGIEWVLNAIEEDPPVQHLPKPAYPDRSGQGIPKRDW